MTYSIPRLAEIANTFLPEGRIFRRFRAHSDDKKLKWRLLFRATARGKIVIIDAGHVGSAMLNSIFGTNLAREIMLINPDHKQVQGID